MAHAKLAVSIVWLSAMLVVAPALATHPPITSKAELTRYLRDTRPGTSPLDRLSPGGRKRFLAQLDFGPRGLGGFSLDDPTHELTQPQIVQLFALFGAEEFAKGKGLTPAEQSRREREREEDAKARGCAVDSCPESDIEQRYDQLVLQKSDFPIPDAQRFTLAGQRYDQLFGRDQTVAHLRLMSRTDLRLLTRAVEDAVFDVPNRTHITQLQMDLAEMQRRGMTDDNDYARLYRALISNRDFDAAHALEQRHPGMGTDAMPTFHKPVSLPPGQPTALTVQNDTMTRQAFDLSVPLRIVVVASCHYSKDAAHAIAADAQLRPIFADHATWLADERESIGSVAEWNREFPDQPIHIAWQDRDWPMLDSWAMPTFYVFRHGRLVKKSSGWYGVKTLKQSLREAGVLR